MQFDGATFSRLVAEFIGTAILVSIGCMGVAGNILYPRTLLSIGIHFGLAVMIAVHIFLPISGCHINPSVSIACMVYGENPWDLMLMYIVSQFLGALAGFVLLRYSLPSILGTRNHGFCCTTFNGDINMAQGFAIEFVLSCVLVYFIVTLWDSRNNNSPDSIAVKIAFLIMGLVFVGGEYTGTSVNLARSFAPALINWVWKDFIIYLLAQWSAAVIVPLAWKYLHTGGSGGGDGGSEA